MTVERARPDGQSFRSHVGEVAQSVKQKTLDVAVGTPIRTGIRLLLPRVEQKVVQVYNYDYGEESGAKHKFLVKIRKAAEKDSAFAVVSTHAGHAGFFHLDDMAQRVRVHVNAVRNLRDLTPEEEKDKMRRRISGKNLIATTTIFKKQSRFLTWTMPAVRGFLGKKDTEFVEVSRQEDRQQEGDSSKLANRGSFSEVVQGVSEDRIIELFPEGNLQKGRLLDAKSGSDELCGMQPPDTKGMMHKMARRALLGKPHRPMTFIVMGLQGEDKIVNPNTKWPAREAVDAVFSIGEKIVPVHARVGIVDAQDVIDELVQETGIKKIDDIDFDWRVMYKMSECVDWDDRGVYRYPEKDVKRIVARVMKVVEHTTKRFDNQMFYTFANEEGVTQMPRPLPKAA